MPLARSLPTDPLDSFDKALGDLERFHAECMAGPRGLRLYTEDIWPLIEPATPFKPNWHLDAMSDHLEAVTRGQILVLLITIPPRHMKSLTVAVAWPTWEWGPAAAAGFTPEGRPYPRPGVKEVASPADLHPSARLASYKWLFASYAQSLSVRDSNKRRQVLNSPYYKARWSHVFTIGEEAYLADGAVKYENSRRGYHMATSVGGSNTGEGGDRIVIDDPIKVDDANSDVKRDGANDWHDGTMTTRRNDPETSAMVCIMQRTHERDLVGHLLEKYAEKVNVDPRECIHLSIPTEYEGTKRFFLGEDPREVPGDLMWPTRFNRRAIEKTKTELGELQFSAQHQQHPSPASGAFFKAQWLRFYAPYDSSLVGTLDNDHPAVRAFKKPDACGSHKVIALPSRFRRTWQSLDAAFKDFDTSDHVCGQVWGSVDALRFLLDNFRERLSFTGTIARLIEQRNLFPACRATLIEDKANGPAIVDSLHRKLRGVRGVPAVESKVARAAATHPDWSAGQVYLPHPALEPWVAKFVKELLAFPFSADDDQVDAMAHALINEHEAEEFDEDRFAHVDLG